MRSLTPILEEGVFSLRFGSIGADVAEESFSFMGFNGNLKQTTGFSGIQMPCSVPASLSPTPVSRRNSNPVGPSAGRQSSPSAASVVVGVNLNLDDGDDFRPARFQAHRRLDRCLSEPTTTAAQQSSRSNSRSNSGAGTNSNSSRYKTELCRAFEETGHCKYGEKCQFAHGHQELRTINRHRKYKTELCRTYHTIGFCPYGPRCHFIHNAEEARTKPSQAPRPLSMSSSSSSSNSSPTHTDSLSGSPTSSSFTMFWAPGDEDRLRLDSPPSAASYRCLNNNCADLDIFVVKPGVAVEYPEFMVTSPGPNSTVNVNINNNNIHHHTNINNNVLTAMAPRLPVFSRLAGTDADPADR